jgi:hypothetical protein
MTTANGLARPIRSDLWNDLLDANPAIYCVEQPPVWGPKANARITACMIAGEIL